MMKSVETNPDPEAKARVIESIVAEHGTVIQRLFSAAPALVQHSG